MPSLPNTSFNLVFKMQNKKSWWTTLFAEKKTDLNWKKNQRTGRYLTFFLTFLGG